MALASSAFLVEFGESRLRDLIRSLFATGIIQLSNIASGIMLARILLPEGRGEFATAMLWPQVIAAIGLLGIGEATVIHVARRHIAKEYVFASALALAIILSVILLPIGWVVVDQVTANLGPSVRHAAFLYLAFIPINQVGLVIIAMYQGTLLIVRWNILRTSVHVINALMIVVFYLLGWGTVIGLIIAALISYALVLVLGFTLLPGRQWFRSGPLFRTMNALTYSGLKVHFSAVVAMLNDRADQLLISLLLSSADLGVYAVATTVSRGLSAIGDTMGTLVFPKITHIEDPTVRAQVVGRYTRAVLLITLLPVMACILLSQWLIVLIFSQSFISAAGVMQILLLAIIPINIKFVLAASLKGANQALVVGSVQTATLAVSLVFLGAFLPTFGLIGAAYAALCSQTAAVILMAIQIHRRLGVRYIDQFLPKWTDVTVVLATLGAHVTVTEPKMLWRKLSDKLMELFGRRL